MMIKKYNYEGGPIRKVACYMLLSAEEKTKTFPRQKKGEKQMGRVKLQLKKIENKTYRHITFAKRKSGLIKKAYELSTLCDVELALMIFSPAGKLILFDGKKRSFLVVEFLLYSFNACFMFVIG